MHQQLRGLESRILRRFSVCSWAPCILSGWCSTLSTARSGLVRVNTLMPGMLALPQLLMDMMRTTIMDILIMDIARKNPPRW